MVGYASALKKESLHRHSITGVIDAGDDHRHDDDDGDVEVDDDVLTDGHVNDEETRDNN